MGRNSKKGSLGFDGDTFHKHVSEHGVDRMGKIKKSSKQQSEFKPQPLIRKPIDPENKTLLLRIANDLEANTVDLEARPAVCGNALDEIIGEEYEIATDYIMSHTLQMLLEECDLDHLCSFLHRCSKVFPAISMDKSGSHVAEAALKSLARHLQDPEAYHVIEETLQEICKVIMGNPIDMMCNCHGSHVLRRLLCLCKGVSLDSSELHGAKSSAVLAERLNMKTSQFDGNYSNLEHQGFPPLFVLLLSGILKCSQEDMKMLQVDQYGSLVLQTALKLSAGNDDELLRIIPIILGCNNENIEEGNYIEADAVSDIVELMKETASSHLMEVILEVVPESLYNEMLHKIFKGSLMELSLDRCGNFVIQALVSHARDPDQMELIWEELGSRFRDLFEQGKPGVVASLIAACQRLHSYEHKCCEALAAAVCTENESHNFIVPRLLFLDNYFSCKHKSDWKWANDAKMHVMGSLILQEIFKFPSDLVQLYITSITSMEPEHIFEAAKDASGARAVEAFLCSNAPAKQKRRLVTKLRGHFGELALHSSGSFTVDKCFDASNLSLREAIASELSAIRNELSKTKQGPYLLRKLDIGGFAAKPDQWRSSQESKQAAYKEYVNEFGSGRSKKKDTFLSDTTKNTSNSKDLKNMREQIDHQLTAGLKRRREEHTSVEDHTWERKKKSKWKKNVSSEKTEERRVINKRPFLSTETMGKKRNTQRS